MAFHEAEVDNKKFYIKKSERKNKKYDVFDENKKYILSFGDTRYQHYLDQWGDYKYLNHLDPYRRNNYRKRAQAMGNLGNPYSANYWAYHTLW